METIDKIIYLLGQKKKTQKELTDFLGIEKSVFSAWKSGKSKSYTKYISKIAQFFSVSVDYLIDNEKSPSNNVEGLKDIYFSLAKEAQNEGIPPEDIKKALELINQLKSKN